MRKVINVQIEKLRRNYNIHVFVHLMNEVQYFLLLKLYFGQVQREISAKCFTNTSCFLTCCLVLKHLVQWIFLMLTNGNSCWLKTRLSRTTSELWQYNYGQWKYLKKRLFKCWVQVQNSHHYAAVISRFITLWVQNCWLTGVSVWRLHTLPVPVWVHLSI